jgi:GNAT superfamily N-acetyltransferase
MEAIPAIRSAQTGDAAAIASFLREVFLLAYSHSSTPANVAAHVATVYGTDIQARELAAPDLPTVVAEDEQGLAAAAQLRTGASAPAGVTGQVPVELRRFYVAERWHGRGLADALMASVLHRAAPLGDVLWLSAWQEAPRAIAFYRRHGFAIAGETTFVVGDDPKRDWAMARALAR